MFEIKAVSIALLKYIKVFPFVESLKIRNGS